MRPEEVDRVRNFKAAARSDLVLLSVFEDGDLLIVVKHEGRREAVQELARKFGLSQTLVLSGEHYRNLLDRERDLALDVLGHGTLL